VPVNGFLSKHVRFVAAAYAANLETAPVAVRSAFNRAWSAENAPRALVGQRSGRRSL
jgi:hypothetical protein